MMIMNHEDYLRRKKKAEKNSPKGRNRRYRFWRQMGKTTIFAASGGAVGHILASGGLGNSSPAVLVFLFLVAIAGAVAYVWGDIHIDMQTHEKCPTCGGKGFVVKPLDFVNKK